MTAKPNPKGTQGKMTREEFFQRLLKEKKEIEALMAHYGHKTDGGEWVSNVTEETSGSEGDDADQADQFETEAKNATVLATLEERLEQVNAKIKEFESSAQ